MSLSALSGAAPSPVSSARPAGLRRLDAAAALAVAVLLLLLALGGRLLGDPDTQWHVAVGRRIWREGAFPWTDTLSHTFAGASWIAKEWLAQLLLAAAQAAAGWTGVAMLTALTVAATLGWMFWWLAGRLRLTAAFALTLLALALTAGHMLARPHVFVFPLLVGWTIALLTALERDGRPPWRLVPLAVLWANLHASFPLGAGIAGLLALEAIGRAPACERGRRIAEWSALGVAIALAFCLTPYGWRPLAVTLSMSAGRNEAMAFITEWQPVTADATGALVVASLAGALGVLLARAPLAQAARLLVIAALGCMALRHLRFVSLFTLVAPLVVATPLGRIWPPGPAASGRASRPARLAALAAAALAASWLAVLVQPRPGPLVAPDAALAAARLQGLSGHPVFNPVDFGGFLIAEGVPTFMDGRSDQLFLGGFTTEVMAAIDDPAPEALGGILERRGIGWALVRTGSAEALHLGRLPGWSRTHEDPVASVYARTGGR